MLRKAVDVDETLDEQTEDRWFFPYRVPKTDRARAVVADVVQNLRGYEKHGGLRKRARKKTDREMFEATITAIAADLIHFHLLGRKGGLIVTRSKKILGRKSRYRPQIYSTGFVTILDRMSTPEMAFVKQVKGEALNLQGERRRTTIGPGWRLVDRIEEHGLTFEDFTTTSDGELIILKRAPRDFWDVPGLMEYSDNHVTNKFREEMRTINAWLAGADIQFDQQSAPDHRVDLSNRRLRRIFTRASFKKGGRLFGGFWQPLPKAIRLRGLRIDGEPVVGLDYSQMNPLLAYTLARAKPSSVDAYAIPGFEEYRPGIKKIFNAMLFAAKPITKMPKGVRKNFTKQVHILDLTKAILDAHQPLAKLFYTGQAHYLQFVESEIMVRLLLTLRKAEVIALPVHDAVVVPASKLDQVRKTMVDQFKSVTGLEISVSQENLG
jgi:hypothetical protein